MALIWFSDPERNQRLEPAVVIIDMILSALFPIISVDLFRTGEFAKIIQILDGIRGHVTEEHEKTRADIGSQISVLPKQISNQQLKDDLITSSESLTHQIIYCDTIHKIYKMMQTSTQFNEYCGQSKIRLDIDLEELSRQYFHLCNELAYALLGLEEVYNKRKHAPQETLDKWESTLYGQRKEEIRQKADNLLLEIKNKLL